MPKRHTTPDGDHEIALGYDGHWIVTIIGESDVLYMSTDYERCVTVVAEVVADYSEHGDSDWDRGQP